MPYRIEDALPKVKELLEKNGATDVKNIDDINIGKRARNRIINAKIDDIDIGVIVFPIVLRNQANGESISDQRYIDINSSAWDQIVSYWKQSCIMQRKCFLLAIRHIDNEIGDYIFSVEGDLSLLSGRSIYIHTDHINDIRNDLNINVYDVPEEKGCKLCIFKAESIRDYILKYENHISSVFLKNAMEKMLQDYIVHSEENISIVEVENVTEGKHIKYYTSKYERKKVCRDAAIKIHGTRCFGCGFEFGEKYGERGQGYIEIHHIKPLYEFDEETSVDPKEDLVPLCANCHRIVHRKKGEVLSLEELKSIIKN